MANYVVYVYFLTCEMADLILLPGLLFLSFRNVISDLDILPSVVWQVSRDFFALKRIKNLLLRFCDFLELWIKPVVIVLSDVVVIFAITFKSPAICGPRLRLHRPTNCSSAWRRGLKNWNTFLFYLKNPKLRNLRDRSIFHFSRFNSKERIF